MFPRSCGLLLLAVLAIGLPSANYAADANQKKTVVTDIREVDSDFKYQGEYCGTIWESGRGCVPVDCR